MESSKEIRLADLQPEWEHENSYLSFVCPTCPPGNTRLSSCFLMLPIHPHGDAELGSERGWKWNGAQDFEKVSLTPSVLHHCATKPHFYITDGAIKLV